MRQNKIPKSIYIFGRKFKIKTTNGSGGSANTATCEIEIGLKYPKDRADIIIHEVLEVILLERGHRYYRYSGDVNENYHFSFNHNEFENICTDLAGAIKQLRRCL